MEVRRKSLGRSLIAGAGMGLAGILMGLGAGCETVPGYENYNSAIGTQAWADLAKDPNARYLLQLQANRQKMDAIDDFAKKEADRVIQEMRNQQAQQAQQANQQPIYQPPVQQTYQPTTVDRYTIRGNAPWVNWRYLFWLDKNENFLLESEEMQNPLLERPKIIPSNSILIMYGKEDGVPSSEVDTIGKFFLLPNLEAPFVNFNIQPHEKGKPYHTPINLKGLPSGNYHLKIFKNNGACSVTTAFTIR
jgi:hypothetical protein